MTVLAKIQTNDVEKTSHEKLAQLVSDHGGGNMLPGRRLQYKQGVWSVDDLAISPDEMNFVYLAMLPTVIASWERWRNNKPAGHVVAPFGKPLPPREALGDLDESGWEKGPDNKPADPWQQKIHLGLIRQHDGAQLVFSSNSVGGRQAVARLANAGMQKPEGLLPIVMLSDGSYLNKKHGSRTQYPEFRVIKWANADGTPVSKETIRAHEQRAIDALDDDIPFWRSRARRLQTAGRGAGRLFGRLQRRRM